jgi:hypothetical protein
MLSMKFKWIIIIWIFFAGLKANLLGDWTINGGAQMTYHSNLSHAYSEPDRKMDFALNPYVYLGNYFQLTESSQIFMVMDVYGNIYEKYHGLDNSVARVSLGFRQKMGLGSFVPWISLQGGTGNIWAREQERSGFLANGEISLGKRILERLDLSGGYEYQRSRTHNAVFEKNDHLLHLKVNFLLVDNMALSASYRFVMGNYVVYHNAIANNNYYYYYPANKLELDTFGNSMEVEKERALLHGLSLDIIFNLESNFSLNLGLVGYRAESSKYSYWDYSAKIGFNYFY